jgi:hypothetical protein
MIQPKSRHNQQARVATRTDERKSAGVCGRSERFINLAEGTGEPEGVNGRAMFGSWPAHIKRTS